MTNTEKVQYRKWAEGLSDRQLERIYYESVFDAMGSEAEKMYEAGWDMADVLEQEKRERDQGVMIGILEGLCAKRGIKLWEDEVSNDG